MSMPRHRLTLLILITWFLLHPLAWGTLGEASGVSFEARPDSLLLGNRSALPSIRTSETDWKGVLRAAEDLREDFKRVLPTATTSKGGVIIVGTLGRHPLIDQLAAEGRIPAEKIKGRWEAHLSQVVDNPAPGIDRALIIAGSDKRGTIYGIYTLSEQIGVSPWYWWADVPTQTREAVHALSGPRLEEGPKVRYRGIFLNDEAPALTGWAREKFGGMNSECYAHVFELILRLKGNYLWPAMWSNAFNEDDPRNPLLADEYGIVMGTSHHEPMIRSQQEWKRHGSGRWDYHANGEVLRDFWAKGIRRNKELESLVTIGMRGDGDEPMSEDANVELLEHIVRDQRTILEKETGKKVTEIPQLWALYKEVQEYYEKGMRVPDDVTLLWCDDNWGNIRRLPTEAERQRSGGAGVYYHFDYVGGPRNYKWINTTQISKVWEQMHLAWKHQADRIWIVNVGDLKPMELPISFFLDYAWNPDAWPLERLPHYLTLWAAREFGPQHAAEIAAIAERTTRLNARIKPELISPETFSLVHDREAETVLAEWLSLKAEVQALAAHIPETQQAAFFQLVEHPALAGAIVNEMMIRAAQNRLHARQGRSDTNALAERVRELFKEDEALTGRYHSLLNGKWNHMMSQVHLGYWYWQQPSRNAMPAVAQLQTPADNDDLGFTVEGTDISWIENFAAPTLPPLEAWRRNSRFIEVFSRGGKPANYELTPSAPWLKVSTAKGSVQGNQRIEVSADWEQVPEGIHEATVTLSGSGIWPHRIAVSVRKPAAPVFGDAKAGFTESNGRIAIEAAHYQQAVAPEGRSWQTIPDYGRTESGVFCGPVEAPSLQPGAAGACLEYTFTTHADAPVAVECHLSPTWAFLPGRGLRYAVSVNDQAPIVIDLAKGFDEEAWNEAVANSIRRPVTKLGNLPAGTHTLRFWLIDPGVVLQRLILHTDTKNRPSFLGPRD